MRTVSVLLALAAVLGLAGGSGAGIPTPPPPGDTYPTWSPDGSVIVFQSDRDGLSLRVVNPDGSDDHQIPSLPPSFSFTYALSPDWSHVAAVLPNPPGSLGAQLVVERLDGTERLSLGAAVYGSRPTWSPDGTRLAFLAPTPPSIPPDVVVARIDGSEAHRVAQGAEPSWSPVDDRIVYLGDRGRLRVVQADGTADTELTPGSGGYSRPTWSPDGTRIAAFQGRVLQVFTADGRLIERFSGNAASDYAWSPRGDSLALSAPQGVLLLDLADHSERKLTDLFGRQLAWSPDGRQLAFSSGGECRNRLGIYRVDVAAPRPSRVTNDCRIVGTPGDDVLRGTALADVLLGEAGNDTLSALSGYWAGDTLDGGPGNDLLLGSLGSDTLEGGPGNDILRGGPGPDLLVGGPGRDVLQGQGGRDLIYARDGQRDVVSCGTNTSLTTGSEGDIAYVDRLDQVSRNCEWVYRPGPAPPVRGRITLAIRIWPKGLSDSKGPHRDFTLRCRPAGGTLPHPGTACARLVHVQDPFAPISPAQPCVFFETDVVAAVVHGVYDGKRVRMIFDRLSSCAIERWDRVSFLFPIRLGAAAQ